MCVRDLIAGGVQCGGRDRDDADQVLGRALQLLPTQEFAQIRI